MDTTENTAPEPVSVIGMGPMGRAMARVLLEHGHRVTVWNRSPGRDDDVVAAGAVRAGSAAEAVAASALTVLSLTDYPAMYDVLAGAADVLPGRVVANLGSDTPGATRDAAGWLAGRGAVLLAGGVMVPAPAVGTDASYVFYGGPADTLAAHRRTLTALGRVEHVGTDPGLAQLYYQAQLTVFLTGLSGYLQATAMLDAAGVAPSASLPYTLETVALLGTVLAGGTAAELERREYPGHLSTATMMGATAAHIADTVRAGGLDTALPDAVRSQYERAVTAGHGTGNWTALWEVVRGPARDLPDTR